MVRLSVLAGVAVGVVVVVGAALVSGAATPFGPPKPPVGPPKPEEKVLAVVGQKVGFFNMAGVMREYKKATSAVAGIQAKQRRVLANLTGMRAMYTELQQGVQKEADPRRRDAMAAGMLMLARRIEDIDRDTRKAFDGMASEIIVGLYDDIRATTVDVARERGLSAVFAYPAPVNAHEAESPQVKELMLKPSAAYPFYLDPSVDYTAELITRLNARFAAENGD